MQPTRETLALAQKLAYAHGIFKEENETPTLRLCTLFPSPFPHSAFEFASSLQMDLNLLYHKVSLDSEYLERIYRHVICEDEFLQRLWGIYLRVRDQPNKQHIILSLNRTDYMMDQTACNGPPLGAQNQARLNFNAAGPNDDRAWPGLTLKQVGVKMGNACYAGLATQIVKLHRAIMGLFNFDKTELLKIPNNESTKKYATALAFAHHLYTQQTAQYRPLDQASNHPCAILIVVASNEPNIYDNTLLMNEIVTEFPHIAVMVHTLEDLERPKRRMSLDVNQRLFVNDSEVAVVYYLAGYSLADYPREATWDVKYLIESSLAIKCPTIQYMLANTKIVQAMLSKPEHLARFVSPRSAIYSKLLPTFCRQYALSDVYGLTDAAQVQYAIKDCLTQPEKYVLKPLSWGETYFKNDLVEKMKELIRMNQRQSYLLVERVYPFVFENHILHPRVAPGEKGMVTELGIFGTFVARGHEILLNENAGQMLRTKLVDSRENEGLKKESFLDSPFLV